MTEQENKSLDTVSSWLKQSAKSKDWQYFNYSEEADFAQLWKIGTGTGERDKTSPLLIDWNGFPSQHSLFPKIVEFITPFDWALAVAYDRVEANPQATSLPQVVIVDRCSHRYPGSFAVEMHRAMADALPHIHIFSALGNDGEDALEFVEFLKKSIPTATRNLRLGQMRALRQAWIGYTVQSGDHHDLSNLLGPLVLASATGAALPSLQGELVTALWQITKWFHLHADGKKDEKGSPEPVLSNVTKAIKEAIKEPVDFLLIDDMAELGWADCVANLLGVGDVASFDESSDGLGENGKRLIKATTPYAFFPNLKDMCKSLDPIVIDSIMPLCGQGDTEEQALAYIPLSPNIVNPSHQQVVFIDLRLFARSVSEERKFLSVCVRAALEMIGENSFVPRWGDERFTGSRLVELQRKIDDSNTDWEAFRRDDESDYLEALSLFIRLLAQRYFTLPLILFSSTGKRKVLEYLKPYGNVISAFDKPRIAGNAIEVEEALNGFMAAIDAAESWISLRSKMQQLWKYAQCAPVMPRVKVSPLSCRRHVEIYVDETGDEESINKDFASGMLVLIYPSVEKAKEMNDYLGITQTTIEQRYLRWTGDGNKLVKLNLPINISDAIEGFKNAFSVHLDKFSDDKPAALGVSLLIPAQYSEWELAGISHMDGIYNQMLRFATEATVYELIPEILGTDDFTWRAFYANRVRPKSKSVPYTPDELVEASAFWGIKNETINNIGMLRTYDKSTFRLLVEGIVNERVHYSNKRMRNWLGAVGVNLNSEADASWPRHVHGLADWFNWHLGSGREHDLAGLFPLLVKQKLNLTANRALFATRFYQQGKFGEALADAIKAISYKCAFSNNNQASKILLKRLLDQVIPLLKGEDVKESMQLIAKFSPQEDEREISEIGQVTNCDDDGFFFKTSDGTNGYCKTGNNVCSVNSYVYITWCIDDSERKCGSKLATLKELSEEDKEILQKFSETRDDIWPDITPQENFELAQVDEIDEAGFFIRNKRGGRYGYCHCSSDDLPKRNDFVIVSWKNWRSDTKEGFSLAEYKALHSTVEAVSASSDGSRSDTERAKLNDQPAEQGRGGVVEKLPLGKNELRIKFKGSVCEGGVAYAVLALEDGKPCALLPMANNQVAECEIGQIVIVKSMHSIRHVKVSHSEFKLSVLEFDGQIHQVPDAN